MREIFPQVNIFALKNGRKGTKMNKNMNRRFFSIQTFENQITRKRQNLGKRL